MGFRASRWAGSKKGFFSKSIGEVGTLLTGDLGLEDLIPNVVGGSRDSKIGIITFGVREVSVS